MKARNVMTVQVTCVTPEVSLADAQAEMRRLCVRHLPVTSQGELVGILSDRDLLMHAALEADGSFSFPDLKVGQVMTLGPITCPPGAPVSKLASLMLEHRIDSLPIVSVGGGLAGLVTSTDLLALLTRPETASEELPYRFDIRVIEGRAAAS
jgi:acetoin utilization protein AcuB